MKLLRDSDKFLKHIKFFLMSKREINMIYMDLTGLKFRQGQLAITSLTLMISSETSLPLLALIIHRTVHFLMRISRPIWEVRMADLMEVHLTTLIQKLHRCHHIILKHLGVLELMEPLELMELLELLELHHILHIFQNQQQIIIAQQGRQEARILRILGNLTLLKSNSYLHKDKQ